MDRDACRWGDNLGWGGEIAVGGEPSAGRVRSSAGEAVGTYHLSYTDAG